jgi:hypothetical protein
MISQCGIVIFSLIQAALPLPFYLAKLQVFMKNLNHFGPLRIFWKIFCGTQYKLSFSFIVKQTKSVVKHNFEYFIILLGCQKHFVLSFVRLAYKLTPRAYPFFLFFQLFGCFVVVVVVVVVFFFIFLTSVVHLLRRCFCCAIFCFHQFISLCFVMKTFFTNWDKSSYKFHNIHRN